MEGFCWQIEQGQTIRIISIGLVASMVPRAGWFGKFQGSSLLRVMVKCFCGNLDQRSSYSRLKKRFKIDVGKILLKNGIISGTFSLTTRSFLKFLPSFSGKVVYDYKKSKFYPSMCLKITQEV